MDGRRRPIRAGDRTVRKNNDEQRGVALAFGKLGIGAVLLALVVAGAVGLMPAVQTNAAPQTVTTYTNSSYGFQLTLPDGWRRSSTLSNTRGLDSRLLAWDVFTARTETDETSASRQGPAKDLPRSWQYVIEVEVWNNPNGLTAMQWALDPNLAGWTKNQVIDSATLGPRTVARQTGGPLHAVSYYVAARSYMFRLGYYRGEPAARPAGATDTALGSIAQSFRAE